MINIAFFNLFLRCNTLYSNCLMIYSKMPSLNIPSFIRKGWVIPSKKNFHFIPTIGGGEGVLLKTAIMKWTLIAMTFGMMILSCKKEKTDSFQCSTSMTGLSGSYKLTALQYKSDPSAVPADYLAFMDDCEKDDILILNSDGAYDYNDAGTVCAPNGTQHGSWAVNGSTLTSDGIFNGTIASYDCKTLVFYTENAIKAGDRLTYTMVKQ